MKKFFLAAKPAAFVLCCLCLLCAALCAACVQAYPTADALQQKLVFEQQENGSAAPRLSAFVRFRDADGSGDFKRMEIKCDAAPFVWTIDRDNCQTAYLDNAYWFGSSRLYMPMGEMFPSGTYTVTVYDFAEHESAINFTLPESVQADIKKRSFLGAEFYDDVFPLSVSWDGKNWIAETELTRLRFFFYDGDNMPAGSFATVEKKGTIAALAAKFPAAAYVRCCAEFEDGSGYYASPRFDLFSADEKQAEPAS